MAALLAILAVLVCLPARAQVYRAAVPEGAGLVEWSTGGAGWEVDVSYDPETCEVYCTYRRTHDALGRMALLPPVTIVRFFDGPLEVAIAVIDPAGVGSPAFSTGAPPIAGECCPTSRRLVFSPQAFHFHARRTVPRQAATLHAGRPVEPSIMLRI